MCSLGSASSLYMCMQRRPWSWYLDTSRTFFWKDWLLCGWSLYHHWGYLAGIVSYIRILIHDICPLEDSTLGLSTSLLFQLLDVDVPPHYDWNETNGDKARASNHHTSLHIRICRVGGFSDRWAHWVLLRNDEWWVDGYSKVFAVLW